VIRCSVKVLFRLSTDWGSEELVQISTDMQCIGAESPNSPPNQNYIYNLADSNPVRTDPHGCNCDQRSHCFRSQYRNHPLSDIGRQFRQRTFYSEQQFLDIALISNNLIWP
jgi:hypothetical protein